jgi:omega-6 fatty acid desaturase (delta-12 desaturase)
MSSVGIFAVLGALGYYARATSFANLARMYIIPWFLTNHWIVALVFVRCSHPSVYLSIPLIMC